MSRPDTKMEEAVEEAIGSHIGTCDYCGATRVWVCKMPYMYKPHKDKYGCEDCIVATCDGRRQSLSEKRIANGKDKIIF